MGNAGPVRSPVGRLALASALVLAAGCTRTQSAGERGLSPWTDPNVVRAAMTGSPNTLDPLLSTQQFEAQIESLIFDPLIAAAPGGRDVPVLAATVPTLENGGISRDGLRITYHLRHGVRWQDGAPFTSADVAFTWRAIMNPNNAVTTRHGYDDVLRVETPDPDTAIFVLRRPFAPAVDTFFATSDSPYMILPAHLLARKRTLDGDPFNGAPTGTGPYRFVRWVRGDRIELAANDQYFLGRPKIARFEIHFVPDENTVVQEMRAHELDWFISSSPVVYPELHHIVGIVVHLVPFNGVDSIIFNCSRAPWSDPRLRRAVGLALDKRALVRDVTYGTTVPATEDLPSFMWAFDPRAGTDRQDVPAARALFAAAGWHPAPSRQLEKGGLPLALDLAFRSDSLTDRERSVVIAGMLHAVGIEVRLHPYTTALLYGPAAIGGVLSSGHYEAGLQTWYAGVDPDDSSQLLCSERPPNGYDWSRYCNPAMDAAQRVALTHYDRATRTRAYATIEGLLARDAPYVYLWWPRQIEAVNADLRRFRPNGIIEDWNAYQWYYARPSDAR